MNKLSIFTLFLSVFFAKNSVAQENSTAPNKPKLVVGIVVDQMRYDFLYRFQSKYGKGGFNRMMTEGFNARNTHFNYGPTVTAAGHAAIFTGSVPNINGIAGNEWYDTQNAKSVYCVEDSSVNTVGSATLAGKMSPKNLLVSTLPDQLRLAQMFSNKTIGIALKDRGAILPAGHTANAAYWFDSKDGRWISSSFYMKELPKWVTKFNDKNYANKYLNTSWEPLKNIATYTESEPDDQVYESKLPGETAAVFPHELLASRGNIYEILKTTPFGNTLTLEFAKAAIDSEKLGQSKDTDFLTISFSSPDYAGHAFGPYSKELEDIYLRLDKDIEDLLDCLDKKCGKGNYTVFLSADHGVADIPAMWQKYKMPAGIAPASQIYNDAKNLLVSKLGEGNWLLNGDNYQFYLNLDLMASKNISVQQVYELLKPSVLKQNGVADFFNLENLANANIPEVFKEKLFNGRNTLRSGQLFVLVKPMWFYGRPTGTTHGTVYNYDSHVPALFYGWGVPVGQTTQRYSITDIAPTIANLLNILAPSGNIGNPIPFK
jgi:predicted AlkP superfamily pyrophosphatase or phosphodiesterase